MRKYFFVPILAALAAYVLLPLPGGATSIDQKIQAKQAQVNQKKHTEGVLTTTITHYNNKISGLQGQINQVQKRLSSVQSDLDGARTELLRTRDQLEGARDRLARARAKLVKGRHALADRLVALYKADEPDLLTVVLSAHGFDDLLNQTDFLTKISDGDKIVVNRVRVLKARAQKAETTLASLEHRKQVAAETILARRDDIARSRDQLASSQGDLRSVRNGRRQVLAKVRSARHADEGDLASLEKEQAKIQGTLAGGIDPGPIHRGSGRLSSGPGTSTPASTSRHPAVRRSAPPTAARSS
jgi:peptidoglycan hydrolase CwlO-like protein